MLNVISKHLRVLTLSLVVLGATALANEHGAPAEGGHEAPAAGGHGAPAGEAEHGTPVEEIPTGHLLKIRELPKDFLLPATLWDQLLSHEVKSLVPVALPDEPGATTMSNVLFSAVTVILTEKNPGVLKEPIVSFELPKGGGEIDLSQWTTGKTGTFFVKFQFPNGEIPSTFEAYHLSKARKRKVEGRIYGGGCRFFYKITNLLLKASDKRGIAVNTTRDFHASTLGGHFIFSWADQEAVQVTQVRFNASATPDLFCNSVAAADKDKPVTE